MVLSNVELGVSKYWKRLVIMQDMGCKISLCEQQIQLGRSVMSRNASDGLPVKLSQHDCNGKTITQIESDLQG